MNRQRMGPLLVVCGIFGGGLLWIIACGLRFDYLVSEVYHSDPGEAIWTLDPVFTLLSALPGLALAMIGLALSFVSSTSALTEGQSEKSSNSEFASHEVSDLFYLGEISLLVAAIVSSIAALGLSQLVVELVQASVIIFGAIAVTGILNLLRLGGLILTDKAKGGNVEALVRITVPVLIGELILLGVVVLALQLMTWSFIRTTTLAVQLSGWLGVALLLSELIAGKKGDGAQGEM